MNKLRTLRKMAMGLAAFLLAFPSAKAGLLNNPQEKLIIVIEPGDDTPPDDPRGPVFNPFTAYRMNNTVVLESDTSYGQVSITLVSTVGDYITTVFDTADSSILIPISGNAGNYTLLLTDSTGAQFIGTFEI
ncbi:MAG: DUF3244 domain-containing protein [Bacteroidales bacterium]|nr:DUF3244 domain-containing protein [Bacteroidales bacterium]